MSLPWIARPVRALPSRALLWVFHLALPLVALAMLAFRGIDILLEDHVIHLWLIAGAAGVSVVLAATVGDATTTPTRRPTDAGRIRLRGRRGRVRCARHRHARRAPRRAERRLLSTPLGLVAAGAFMLVASLDLPRPQASTVARLRCR